MNRVGAVYNRNQNSVNNQLSPAMNREFNNYNGNTARSQPAENYNSGSMASFPLAVLTFYFFSLY